MTRSNAPACAAAMVPRRCEQIEADRVVLGHALSIERHVGCYRFSVRALAFLAVGLVVACGSATVPIDSAGSPGASPAASPSAPVVWPLRGTTASDASATKRRPIVVKVANDSAARPQTGMAQADLILEIPVEGGITRYALVFHSQDPDRVGPVRSARQSDLNYISMLKAIVVHVGASQPVAAMVRDA